MTSRVNLTQKVHELTIEFAKAGEYREDLCGLCAISSSSLYQAFLINDKLYDSGYNPSLLYGKTVSGRASHCWVESDSKVYDTTFKQFGLGKNIHIGQRTVKHEEFSKRLLSITNIGQFFTWDSDQKPTQERINWFLERIFSSDDLRYSEKVKNKVFKNRSKYFSFASGSMFYPIEMFCER